MVDIGGSDTTPINGVSHCISSISKKLHIIKANALYIIIAEEIQPTADDIHALRDDIPLLPQWIKKALAKASAFLAPRA